MESIYLSHWENNKSKVAILVVLALKVPSHQIMMALKVHKNENFFGSDFEFCTISLLVMFKY